MIMDIESQMLLLVIFESFFDWITLVVHFRADEAACPIGLIDNLVGEEVDGAVIFILNGILLYLIIEHLFYFEMELQLPWNLFVQSISLIVENWFSFTIAYVN